MRKSLLTFIAAALLGGMANAQNITIVYDANGGTAGLGAGAANKVYLHSGGGEAAAWEATVGNWGLDDGVGLMTETSDDIWEISFVAEEYYAAAGYTGSAPVNFIGMVFRNEDGTLEGKNEGGADIFATYNGVSYDVDCSCVTITITPPQSIYTTPVNVSDLTIGPNPFSTTIEFAFNLDNANMVSLSIYNMLGEEVANVINETKTPGKHNIQWSVESNMPSGNYMYRLQVGDSAAAGSIIKL